MQLSEKLEAANKDYENLAITYRQLQIGQAALERRVNRLKGLLERARSALDDARCTVHNALEAERSAEAPITEQCHVFIGTRKRIIDALSAIDAEGKE